MEKKLYKELKDKVWVKDGKMYTIIKLNCKKCMGKRYVIRNFIESNRIREVTSSCSCVVEQKMAKKNITNQNKESVK